MRRLVRAFEEDQPEDGTAGATASDAEYVFEGYTIDFSTKVMLTPAVTAAPATAPTATSQSRRR